MAKAGRRAMLTPKEHRHLWATVAIPEVGGGVTIVERGFKAGRDVVPDEVYLTNSEADRFCKWWTARRAKDAKERLS